MVEKLQNRDVRVVIQFATCSTLDDTRQRMDSLVSRYISKTEEWDGAGDNAFPLSFNGETVAKVEWDTEPEQPAPTVEEAFKAGWAARDIHLSSYLTVELSEEWANKDWLTYLKEHG